MYTSVHLQTCNADSSQLLEDYPSN